MCVSGVIMLIIVCLSSLEDISSCPQLTLDLSLSVTFRTIEGVTGSIYILRAAAKSQKGPRKGTYPYRRYSKTQLTFFGALLCPLYEKIGCGETKLV